MNQKEFDVWEFLNNPIVKAIAFGLWGVPIYVFLPRFILFVSQQIPLPILEIISLDLSMLTVISESDQAKIGNFIEWFGVLYGLVLALVLVNVWTQFATTERAFDNEADTVFTLYNTSTFLLNDKLKLNVYRALTNYVNKIKDNYNSGMGSGTTDDTFQDDSLKNVRESINEIINNKKEHDLALKLLDLLNQLLDVRGDRKSYAKQRLPPAVYYLSIIASMTWLIPFFALKFDNPLVGPMFIVIVTWVVVSILLIIIDLDEPIGGSWRVKFDTWDSLIKKLSDECNSLELKLNKSKSTR